MKYLKILLSLVILFSFSCKTPNKVTNVSRFGNVSKLKFSPSSQKIKTKNGLIVRFTPVSADTLNQKFRKLVQTSGKYKYSDVSTKVNKYVISDEKEESKEKSDLQKIIEGLNKYQAENDIPNGLIDLYISDLISEYGSEREKNNLLNKTIQNPYYINDKYLSVFELSINNPTGKKINLKLSDVKLYNEKEKLYIYPSENLKRYQKDIDNHFLIDRCNFPSSLTIYPNDTIISYLSTSPIEKKDGKLDVYITDNKAKFSTKYIERNIKKEINFAHLKTDITNNKIFAAYKNKNGDFTKLNIDDNDILIPKSIPIQKIHVLFYKKYRGKFHFEHKLNIKLNKYKKEDGVYKKLDLDNKGIIDGTKEKIEDSVYEWNFRK